MLKYKSKQTHLYTNVLHKQFADFIIEILSATCLNNKTHENAYPTFVTFKRYNS